MKVFSREILKFNQKAKRDLRTIILNETEIDIRRSRFLINGYFYPLTIESFEDNQEKKVQTLGFFDSNTLTINLNFSILKTLNSETYLNLLKHEFAHYLTYINHGKEVAAHGSEFQNICKHLNWGTEVSSASIELKEIDQSNEKKKDKYKKLMNLAKSSNIYEATLALEKAALLKIEEYQESNDDDKSYFLDQLIQFKRRNHKIEAIYQIMKEMNFGLVFKYGQDHHLLESFGSKEQVNQSKEIFEFLNSSLDQIYKIEKIEKSLKGLRDKNSFFKGFCKGVISNLRQKESQLTKEHRNSLISLQLEVFNAQELIYGKLSTTYGQSNSNHRAESLGFQSGRNFDTNFKKHTYLT